MTDLSTLIEDLKAAKEGSRELDARIYCALYAVREIDTALIRSLHCPDNPDVYVERIEPKDGRHPFWFTADPPRFTTVHEGLRLAFRCLEVKGCDDWGSGRDNLGYYFFIGAASHNVARHSKIELAAWIAVLSALMEEGGE